MEKFLDITTVGLESISELTNSFIEVLPNVIGAVLLVVIGWVVGKGISYAVTRALKALKFDRLSENMAIEEMFGDRTDISPSKIAGKFVYWVIILIFFISASDTLGWTVVSESIRELLTYLPQLFSAIVIFIIGYYIAGFVRKGLRGILDSLGISASKLISAFAFYIILILLTLTALDQAGIDTSILTSNVTVVVGGIILSFAISFGIASRGVLLNILSSFYTKSNFEVGQEVEIGDVKGTIVKIDITSCVIKGKDFTTVVPVSKLLSENVRIKD